MELLKRGGGGVGLGRHLRKRLVGRSELERTLSISK